ncbi:hypothetical protein BJV78DRAFT_920584 [Lactifluus subvellereus]|nr:hypothetical protein BJV78DRAFT_920584 [Lactifluus subvellereus]
MGSSTRGSPRAGSNAPLKDENIQVTEEEVHKSPDYSEDYPILSLRRLFALAFVWLIKAAFITLPGAVNTLKKAQTHSNGIVEEVLHSIQNIPLLVLSTLFCLIGFVGICVVSWHYTTNHGWLFYQIHYPLASGGLYGVVSTIANIYTAHGGKYSPSSIATLAAMGAITVVFGLFALNSYFQLRRRSKARVAPRTG